MRKFSKDLIEKVIVYFLKKYSIELSEEKAEQYLDAIADFYLVFIEEY